MPHNERYNRPRDKKSHGEDFEPEGLYKQKKPYAKYPETSIGKHQKNYRSERALIRNAKHNTEYIPGNNILQTRIENFKTGEEIKEAVQILCSKQKDEDRENESVLNIFRGNDPQKILSVFKQTTNYKKLYNRAEQILNEPGLEDHNIKNTLEYLSGEFYNKLAYLGMASRMSSRGVVLSPERTMTLYRDELYPDRRRLFHDSPFNNRGLKNTSIPSSLLINHNTNDPELIGIYQFNTNRIRNEYNEKYDIYTNQLEELKGRYPNLVNSNASIIFVTPLINDGNIPLPDTYNKEKSEFPPFPVTYSNIWELMNYTLAKISVQSIKTLDTNPIFHYP